jgi:hypothetical protein
VIDLNELKRIAREHKLQLPVSSEALHRTVATSALALFHEPLLALVIALIARHRKGDLRASEASVWTAATLANSYFGFRTKNRLSLEWSATFRERCASALVILETLAFIELNGPERKIQLSTLGKKEMKDILDRNDETGMLARRLERSCVDAFRLGLELL